MFSKGSIPYQFKIKQKLIQITFEQFFFQTNFNIHVQYIELFTKKTRYLNSTEIRNH